MTVNGKQWGVPLTYYQWGVYYRTDIFKKYGLGEPRSIADLMHICNTLKQNGVTPFTIGTKYLWTAAGWFDFLNLRVNGYGFHMSLMDGNISYEDSRLDKVFEILGLEEEERGFDRLGLAHALISKAPMPGKPQPIFPRFVEDNDG